MTGVLQLGVEAGQEKVLPGPEHEAVLAGLHDLQWSLASLALVTVTEQLRLHCYSSHHHASYTPPGKISAEIFQEIS